MNPSVAQIKEENPRLARDSKVLRVTMDNVYEVFTTPRETTGLQGIHFRFMPDMNQVKHALQVGGEGGGGAAIGVVVFGGGGVSAVVGGGLCSVGFSRASVAGLCARRKVGSDRHCR